ncbi:hypothetical protein [Fibrella forsythiae]|uniref:Uncharacterized protein n=1 Tax=Fibrella forsythiae TaxID=2817061 RepID=A0ABS3JCJ4_9BACT|nr:hypothetical protein [Fibrella forsythiae]MBO0946994.1 hypothetical protein [Fibrella forsythiae]
MLPLTYTLPAFLNQLNTTTKVGDKVIFTDFTKGTPQYTEVTGGVKKKVSFQEILNYGTQIGGLAVNLINALKSPGTAAAASSSSGLSSAELMAANDLKAQADIDTKAKQRQYLIFGGIALLVIIAATIIFKSKK